jgi:hypothetical protein
MAHPAAHLARFIPDDVLSIIVQALGGRVQDVAAAARVARAWRSAARDVRKLTGVRPTSISAVLKTFPNVADLQIEGPAGPAAGEQPAAAAGAAGGQTGPLLLQQLLAAPAEARHVRRLRVVNVDAVEALGEAAASAAAARAAGGSGGGDWLLSLRRLEALGAPVTPRGLQLLSEGLPALEVLAVHQAEWRPLYRAPMAAHALPSLRRLELRGGGGEIVRCWEPLPLVAFAPSVEHLVLAGFDLPYTADLAGLTRLEVRSTHAFCLG